MYKVIIAGTRTFNDYNLLESKIDFYLSKKLESESNNIEIVSGTCYGTDLLGEQYAIKHNLPVKRFPADWSKYGRSAGPIRNAQMADYADACIIFWDGRSRGTKSMIELAEQKGLAIRIVYI